MADYSAKTSVKNLPALLEKVTVLVVDPDPPIANIIKHVLSSLGFVNILIEHDSKVAVKTFVANTIDFIITDFDLTPVDGERTFVEFIRNAPESPNPVVPIILLTGHTEQQDIESARDQGVTEITAKPFTAKSLSDRIIRVIENPRSFIITKRYTGPDRRRRSESLPAGADRRKNDDPTTSGSSIFKRLLGKKS
jgi:two-component system, chemotaxis family, chemotaxis protein CheY